MTSETVAENSPSKRPTRPAPSPPSVSLSAIERPARHAERRLRTRRAILWAAKATAGALVAVAVLLVLRKTGVIGERMCRVGLALGILQVFVVAAVAFM